MPWPVLTMNSQRCSSAILAPQALSRGGHLAWFFKSAFPKDYKSPVRDCLAHKHDLATLASANLKHIGERELTRRNRWRRPASFKVGDLVLVHHS